MSYKQELKTALQAASLAGAIQLESRCDQLGIEYKSDTSPVTDVDLRCEQVILATIAKAFPADGFLGEESGLHKGRSGRTWIVDPLDGTPVYPWNSYPLCTDRPRRKRPARHGWLTVERETGDNSAADVAEAIDYLRQLVGIPAA